MVARRRRLPGALALALTLLALPGAALAQDLPELPADVDPRPEEEAPGPELPEPPADFRSDSLASVTWTYPVVAAHVAEDLQETFDDAWEKVRVDLGGELDGPIVIRIARNPDEMRTLAPVGHPPPAYASGVAYPAFGVILLTLSAPDTWARPDMESVFVHELAHIGLHRALEGRHVPRWFNEGVAIHIAEEQGFERIKTLWNGSLQDRLIPIERLDARFPAHPHEVNLAYAQSADIVRHLRQMESGERRFRRLIREIRRGASFEEALDEAYFLTTPQLEREWLESVAERRRSVPLLIGGSTIWVLASILAFFAWKRRRWQFRLGIARLGRQERAEEQAIERIEALVQRRLEKRPLKVESGRGAVANADDNADAAGRPTPTRPSPGEPELPRVEHEGQKHTLH